jgi:hypothetical protein
MWRSSDGSDLALGGLGAGESTSQKVRIKVVRFRKTAMPTKGVLSSVGAGVMGNLAIGRG